MSVLKRGESSRGVTILAALMFVAILGAVFAGLEALSPQPVVQSQTAQAAGTSITSSNPIGAAPSGSGTTTQSPEQIKANCDAAIADVIKNNAGGESPTKVAIRSIYDKGQVDNCTAARYSGGNTADPTSYKCAGRTLTVIPPKPPSITIRYESAINVSEPAGSCVTMYCDALGSNCKPGQKVTGANATNVTGAMPGTGSTPTTGSTPSPGTTPTGVAPDTSAISQAFQACGGGDQASCQAINQTYADACSSGDQGACQQLKTPTTPDNAQAQIQTLADNCSSGDQSACSTLGVPPALPSCTDPSVIEGVTPCTNGPVTGPVVCDAGQVLSASGVCGVGCLAGQTPGKDACVQPAPPGQVICGPGLTLLSDGKTCAKSCPPGTVAVGDTCTPQTQQCPGGNCTTQPPPHQQSTFPPQQQGYPQQQNPNGQQGAQSPFYHLGRMIGSLIGGNSAPPPPAQTMQCATTQDQYQQQQQYYQQAYQQYQYQYQQYQYQQQQAYYSGGYGATGYPPQMPAQPPSPCYNNNNPSQCQNSPQTPDPSQCTTGTWKPTSGGGNGCISGWQCVPNSNQNPNNPQNTVPQAQLSCEPQVADTGMQLAISFSCGNSVQATGSGFDTGGQLAGSVTTPVAPPPPNANTATYSLKCSNAMGQTTGAQCSVQVGNPAIVLVANPASVVNGDSSTIGWITSGMQSCVVSSPEMPDFTAANAGYTNANGVATTSPITGTTHILLHCETLGGQTSDANTTVGLK